MHLRSIYFTKKEKLYMKLQEYLDRFKTPKSVLARSAGISRVTIDNILIKKMIPNLKTALGIEKATNGLVSVYDWLQEVSIDTDANVDQCHAHDRKKRPPKY